jgi:hypothetical protein
VHRQGLNCAVDLQHSHEIWLEQIGKEMHSFPIITGIWDYGWLAGDDGVECPHTSSDREMLRCYLNSKEFHTSFLPSEKDETGIHGPFVADRISENDFVPFAASDLEGYLAALLYSPEWDSPASSEQFDAVLEQLRIPFEEGMRCYNLRFDESRSDLQHEWGSTFVVFRELLFVDDKRRMKRFVIGYD